MNIHRLRFYRNQFNRHGLAALVIPAEDNDKLKITHQHIGASIFGRI